ncbi:MAG TPA: peptidylprolyl isomerase [Thermoanaerobaculia bacterium]|nr:peptidylprolyl isomerase [Thermoanaerobaculia bacterium]
MKKSSIVACTLLALVFAAAAPAQQAADDDKVVVATVNGEIITRAKLDMLYANMNSQMRANYDRAGGRLAFLDNYIAKRLMLQEAMKSGFEERPEVKAALDAARESALFDRYVRDVVGGEIVTEADVRKYYQDNQPEFATPGTVKVNHIVVSWRSRPKEEARAIIDRVAAELKRNDPLLRPHFNDAARKYSEDGVAAAGGDLGWMPRGSLDPKFEEAAYSIKPGTMSDVVESQFGYHLLFVEARRDAGFKPLDVVRPDIRERLVAQRQTDIMSSVRRLTNELRQSSAVSIYRENVE